jgi:hypothetical protein
MATLVRETVRATSINRCIYCGATEGLTDEHVVPFALGGRFVLPDASCLLCAEVTSEFERRVLRGFMHDARVAGNFPSRHRKQRPKTLPLQIDRAGTFEQVHLDAPQHPALLILPLLAPPGFLLGRAPEIGVTCVGYETLSFGKHPTEAAKRLNTTSIRTVSDWDLTSYARLLAKIAYGFAVAQFGFLPLAQVLVLQLIRGERDDGSVWLGSAEFTMEVEAQQPTHAVAVTCIPDSRHPGDEFIIARVKLFVATGATGYEVLVARRTHNTA